MKITRLPDWQIRIDLWYKKMCLVPMVYGVNDCCMMVADAVIAMTGLDFAKQFRGTYSTELGAAKVIQKHNGYINLINSLGFVKKDIKFLNIGDIVLLNQDGRELLGLCMGAFCIAQGEKRIENISIGYVTYGWGV